MNILVTGSTGLIGFHLIELLLNENENVIGYDKKSSTREHPNYTYEQGDLTDFPRLASVVKKHKIDALVHSGGASHPKVGNESPNSVVQTNIVGTNNVLEASRLFNIKKIIYMSSAAIYGDNTSPHLSEEEKPQPTSIYGVSKISGEYLSQVFSNEFGLNITILRLPFVYGPKRYMPDPISDNLYKAIEKKEIALSNTQQKLEFIYVKDVARAIYLTLHSKGVNGEIFNIGSGRLTPMREITNIIYEIFPEGNFKKEYMTGKYDQIGSLDCSKARKLLKFTPHYSLKDGIIEYAHYISCNV